MTKETTSSLLTGETMRLILIDVAATWTAMGLTYRSMVLGLNATRKVLLSSSVLMGFD